MIIQHQGQKFMDRKVTKAVFPVAGLGTRFLPATKANPKEMLPIVDKPLIQYAAEEAVKAGINELIFVTSSSKRALKIILTRIMSWKRNWRSAVRPSCFPLFRMSYRHMSPASMYVSPKLLVWVMPCCVQGRWWAMTPLQ